MLWTRQAQPRMPSRASRDFFDSIFHVTARARQIGPRQPQDAAYSSIAASDYRQQGDSLPSKARRSMRAIARRKANAARAPQNPVFASSSAAQSSHHDDPRRSQRHAPSHHPQKVVPIRLSIPTLIPPMTSSTSPSPPPQSTTQTPMSRSPHSHQRNRELLEPGQAHAQSIQRHSESPLSALSQGDRVSLQLWKTQPAIANSQTLGQTQALANRSGTAPFFISIDCNPLKSPDSKK